ncbi:hypothetical protein [Ruania zhangjianzhongii]|uniref:hypothetical protein n=1 Tax=Ruania zhangjianzhongii TaxID=2603206 RepID=UPI001F3227A9|nr:hypothetical protein [Ruania zhangjianzhongii]
MSEAAAAHTSRRQVAHSSAPFLGPKLRKTVLVVHVLAGGTWIGVDVIVAVLVLVGRFSNSPGTAGLAYHALGTFALIPMLTSGLTCLGTGLLLGWGTRWGLVRYRWVLVKLVITVVLCVLIVAALAPGMPEVVAHGEALAAGAGSTADMSNLFFPPAVSLVSLSFATVLAVFKPWGKVRRRG